MRKFLFLSACTLLLAACTGKEILVTDPVDLNFKIEEVKGTRIIFSVDPSSPDATYLFFAISEHQEDQFNMSTPELITYMLDLQEDGYNWLNQDNDYLASYTDVWCYRGSRTLRLTNLYSGARHKLVLFQIHPETHQMIGTPIVEEVTTLPVEMKELNFSYKFDGEKMTITPSDPGRLYYWDYDPAARIYDNYNWPYGFFYSLLDMFDEYGFMEEVYSKGAEEYDFAKDNLVEGVQYIIVAAGCQDGEINSEVDKLSFIYHKGNIEVLGNQ